MNDNQIKKLILGVVNRLEESISENIDFTLLKGYKNILIIRSAKIDYFENLRRKLSEKYGINRFHLIGDFDDYNMDYYENNVIDFYAHSGRIDERFINAINNIKSIKKIDAIIYLSYEIFRPSYLNVLQLANTISSCSDAKIFAYQVKSDSLTFLKDPKFIQYGIQVLPFMVSAFNSSQ